MTGIRRNGRAPRRTVLPRRIDGTKIFRLDVDDDLWQDDPGLGEEAFDTLPPWQGDEKVRNGITAMLVRERCLEEKERLDHECSAMQTWLSDEFRVLNRTYLSNTSKSSPGANSFHLTN